MPDDSNYSKREMDVFMKSVNDRFDKLDTTLERIENNQSDTKTKVAILEDTVKDYPDMKKAVAKLTNYKYWLIGAIAAFTVLIGAMAYLINANLDGKISIGITDYFNSHYSKVEVVNP